MSDRAYLEMTFFRKDEPLVVDVLDGWTDVLNEGKDYLKVFWSESAGDVSDLVKDKISFFGYRETIPGVCEAYAFVVRDGKILYADYSPSSGFFMTKVLKDGSIDPVHHNRVIAFIELLTKVQREMGLIRATETVSTL